MAICTVTGASGHIGGNLVRLLLQSGHQVRAVVHRDRRALEGLDLESVPGDLLQPATLREAFDGAEWVFHLAAYISIASGEEAALQAINVEGVRNVVDACFAAGVTRLVHFSSVHALDPSPLEEVVDESRAPAGPGRPSYDRSKAAGEEVVRDAVHRGLDAVIVSPSGVIGPHDYRPSHMGQALLDMAGGRLPGLVAGGFDWVDARDVVAGALAAADRGQSGRKYILSGHWASVPALAALVAELTGGRVPRLVCPMWVARLVAPGAALFARVAGRRPQFTPDSLAALRWNQRLSHARARQELGYDSRPLRQTLQDTLAWFSEQGLLPT